MQSHQILSLFVLNVLFPSCSAQVMSFENYTGTWNFVLRDNHIFSLENKQLCKYATKQKTCVDAPEAYAISDQFLLVGPSGETRVFSYTPDLQLKPVMTLTGEHFKMKSTQGYTMFYNSHTVNVWKERHLGTIELENVFTVDDFVIRGDMLLINTIPYNVGISKSMEVLHYDLDTLKFQRFYTGGLLGFRKDHLVTYASGWTEDYLFLWEHNLGDGAEVSTRNIVFDQKLCLNPGDPGDPLNQYAFDGKTIFVFAYGYCKNFLFHSEYEDDQVEHLLT